MLLSNYYFILEPEDDENRWISVAAEYMAQAREAYEKKFGKNYVRAVTIVQFIQDYAGTGKSKGGYIVCYDDGYFLEDWCSNATNKIVGVPTREDAREYLEVYLKTRKEKQK